MKLQLAFALLCLPALCLGQPLPDDAYEVEDLQYHDVQLVHLPDRGYLAYGLIVTGAAVTHPVHARLLPDGPLSPPLATDVDFSNQYDLAPESAGTLVVVWVEHASDEVLLRRYADQFVPASEIMLVTEMEATDRGSPTVSLLPNGGIVVYWEERDGSSGAHVLRKRKFNAQLVPVTKSQPAAKRGPRPAQVDGDGNWLDVWTVSELEGDAVLGQWLNPDRTPRTDVFVIDDISHALAIKQSPAVAVDAVGQGLVVWEQTSDDTTFVVGQQYTALRYARAVGPDGPQGLTFPVHENTIVGGVLTGNLVGAVDVAVDGAGSALVLWSESESTEGGSRVLARPYESLPEDVVDTLVGAHSGSFFYPPHSGQGVFLEVVEVQGRRLAQLYWFTYTDDGKQFWFIAIGELQPGGASMTVYRTEGGSYFGPAFDPDAITLHVWGVIRLVFFDCNSALLAFYSAEGAGTDSFPLTRLTELNGLECEDKSSKTADGQYSGSWFNPDESGHGLALERILDSSMQAYWFTYDQDGNHLWLAGIGDKFGDGFVLDTVRPTGGRFVTPITEAPVTREPWGTLTFLPDDCFDAVMEFIGPPAFGTGAVPIERFTQISGLECGD